MNVLICVLGVYKEDEKSPQDLNELLKPCVTFARALINAAHVTAEKRFYGLCRGIFLPLQTITDYATVGKKPVNSIDALDTANTFKPSSRKHLHGLTPQ